LELDSDDGPLNQRFSEIYPEGVLDGSACASSARRVRCRVRSLDDPAVAAIDFEDPEALDSMEFCRALFPDRNYVPGPEGPAGWRTISFSHKPAEPLIAMSGTHAMADRRQVWQPLVANLAVNRVLRLQREVLFFHAASARVGARGMMFVGPKGSGKTTTSLTLASRGHGFLGDEVAAVCPADLALLPFRRAASIRKHGLRAERLERRLEQGEYPIESFPDGSARILASVGDLFPGAPAEPARLSDVFFLRGFAPEPRVEPFAFGMEHFPLLTPLASSLWGVPAGMRMLQLSRLLKQVRCYHLDAGSPDRTAELLENIAKESLN
jgi:hypothetical protein